MWKHQKKTPRGRFLLRKVRHTTWANTTWLPEIQLLLKKLQQLINEESNEETFNYNSENITGFRFCDMELFADVFGLLRCPECECVGLSLKEDDVSHKGCASKLRLCCQRCDWKHLFWTAKRTEKSFEINKRLTHGMRRRGKGL